MVSQSKCLWRGVFGLTVALAIATPASAQGVPQNDNLNAVLWMQRSVEYKGATMSAFALARLRLDQALADKTWTGAPGEQTGNFQDLPPAVILDGDETVLDNSPYEAYTVVKNKNFDGKEWDAYVKSGIALAIPGAVEFTKYAESKGVKVFYVTNRTADEEDATRKNMEKLGFAMGGNVDTFLMNAEKPEWTSRKSSRRAFVAKDYRILLLLGDNVGDFVDSYATPEADRLKTFEANAARWGREWIVLPNPSYGSFESAPFEHKFSLSDDDKRKAKLSVLYTWPGQ